MQGEARHGDGRLFFFLTPLRTTLKSSSRSWLSALPPHNRDQGEATKNRGNPIPLKRMEEVLQAHQDLTYLCEASDLVSMSRLTFLKTFSVRKCACRATRCVVCGKRCHITLLDGYDVPYPVLADDGLLYDAGALAEWVRTCNRCTKEPFSVVDPNRTLLHLYGMTRTSSVASRLPPSFFLERSERKRTEDKGTETPPGWERDSHRTTSATDVSIQQHLGTSRMVRFFPRRIHAHAPFACKRLVTKDHGMRNVSPTYV